MPSMTSYNKPSIFTSRESFSTRPLDTPTADTPRAHSPLRRRSNSDALDGARSHAAGGAAPFFCPSSADQGVYAAQDRDRTQGIDDNKDASIWTSLRSGERVQDITTPARPASKGRSASAGRVVLETPPTEQPPSAPPRSTGSEGRKRPADLYNHTGPTSEPSSKRQRLRLNLRPRQKHFLESFSPHLAAFQTNFEPPSPLFFSNSPRARPSLPPRFSSSEAAAKMLSKTRSEDNHVKTVSLARGIVTTPSAMPTSVPQLHNAPHRGSLDRPVSQRSMSPEPGSRDVGAMLNSIGILELLEQDERPTFMVDLAVRENYGAGPLQLAFANTSLRSYTGLEALVSGRSVEDTSPGPSTYLQFKAWLMSAAINGESLEVCLPSFIFANMSWSCSTLRKRLRIISGAFTATPGSSRGRMLRASIPPSVHSGPPTGNSVSLTPRESSDYFGAAARVESPDAAGATIADPVPSVERPTSSPAAKSSSKSDTPMYDANSKRDHHELPGPFATQSLLLKSQQTSSGSVPLISLGGSSDEITPNEAFNQMSTSPPAPSFDWTRLPVSASMPAHIQFARSVDWASTSLGPIDTWGPDLRQMCNLIMASPHPAAMYWGDDYIAIYNEAYVMLAGQKHPKLMGQSYREAWAEIWDEVKDVFAAAKATGEATMKDDDCLFVRRSNYLEETYFSWSIIPMVGRDGSVMGLYNPAFEKTRRKIAERRMLTLREVGERTASARDIKGFWAQVLGSFEFNEYDSPFLLLYSVADDLDSDTSSINSNSVMASRQCLLEGKLGIPDGHPAAPEQIDLRSGGEGFGPVFREVMNTDKHLVLEVGSKDLPESLLRNMDLRGFPDRVQSVVVCPIHPTTGESILGFLVIGVNARRPYDDDYALFVQLLSRQLATSLASVVLFEEEIRRGQRAAKLAALDRIELSEKLAQRTQEAIDSETKFTRMAEFAPVGMVIAGSDGKLSWANDTWYDISRMPRHISVAEAWIESVVPEDRALVEQLWEDLTKTKKAVSSEFRFQAQWEDRNGTRGDTWVLFSGYPEKYEDGRLKSVFASITNISQQKWAEGIQTRKMEEAVELKRQQENFIDITSHEMRNPLSAILQCSDEIANSLSRFRQSDDREITDEVLTSCLDAAQIISLCSQHQKRIVDDVLTLSKLDSQLLLVTPVDAQPLTVVQRALKMHEGELSAADIQLQFVVDQSYLDLDLDWVRFDPSRVLQVLINLTTNAIKFTGTEEKRTISVTISASRDRPSENNNAPVRYFPSRRKNKDAATDKDWGDGEKVYIHFAVRDTGRGLKPEEKNMLFLRFSQASPRTHVQYGGSGLGLFISRELTELQGGEIGCESEAGIGSTFAFYVVARRSTAPADTDGATGIKQLPALPISRKKSPKSAAATKKRSQSLDDVAESIGNSIAHSPPRAAIKKVLIVEDNLVNQRVLSKQLKNIGTEVHVANHGGEALEKLRQSTYWSDAAEPAGPRIEIGVVLMDQEMPVMDGLTCTRKIRELEKEGKLIGHVPIIAVTANARAEQVQTALDAGMDDVVSKPFRIPELIPKIDELLAKYPAPHAA